MLADRIILLHDRGRMNVVDRLIKGLGGIRPASLKISETGPRRVSPSSVSYWKRVGHVPARRQRQVLATAERHGLAIGPADFFESPPC